MIINSKFSSLFLGQKQTWKAPFDQDVCYIQKVAVDEEIRIQFIGFTPDFSAHYISQKGLIIPLDVELLYTHTGNDGKRLYEVLFSVDTVGVYQFILTNGSDKASTHFCVEAPENLTDTLLFNYTHRRNEYDTLFVNPDGTPKVFNFRVEGGFYPGDKTQAIENETFRDQRFQSYQTAAESYEIAVLTIGTKKGVPQWVGSKINNLFKLSDVLVDDIETSRNESSTPELIQLSPYYPLYVFKINVEQPDEDRIYTTHTSRIFDTTYDKTHN